MKISRMTQTAFLSALIAVMSQIMVPTPWGIPFTMQVFAVALAGFLSTPLQACVSVLIYILLGAAGVPVFSGFRGGSGELLSVTGGFIFGFAALALFCSLSLKIKFILGRCAVYIIGIFMCHFVGCVHFAFVSETTLLSAFVVSSLPYIIKDILFVVLAYIISFKIAKVSKYI